VGIGADRVLRVLVVDDSAYARKAVREMLVRSPFLEVVGAARSAQEALELVAELKPDVITCDLVMPEMDGADFVRAQMAIRPVPIVIISSVPRDEALMLGALEAGAVDFVRKPTALASDRLLEIGNELIAKVEAAAGAPVARLGAAHDAVGEPVAGPVGAPAFDILVIGISTGGPQALRALIPQLPSDLPVPVVVVLHMPVGYTELYARKLDQVSGLTVLEAQDGTAVRPGRVLVAPGGWHLSLVRDGDGLVSTRLDMRHRDTSHRPSVNLLFETAAKVYGGRVLGVVMTGMGSDGCEGAAWIKAKGGTVITEAQETCVVYGMPRAVVEAGLSDGSYPLERMAQAIVERL
jgi:two-component system, chemotaxis family, protein-glutamate methylesterase/glutaminase